MRRTFIIGVAAVAFLACPDGKFQNPAAPADRTATAAVTQNTGRHRAVTQPMARGALSGTWGGEHVSLELDTVGGLIEFDCGRGTLTQPIVPLPDGTFSVAGTFTREGGPAMVGEISDPHPARYRGTVSGDTMELIVAVDSQELPDRFALVKGQSPRLTKCL